MPEPTPEQAAVIFHEGGDLVVTAGAGSGKTQVLVQRFLRLLETHAVGELAAMTFTESAAAELRERVRRELAGRPGRAQQLRDLDSALIGTMHSICLRILRDHPVEAGLDPDFDVLAEDESEFELAEACADAIEAAAVAEDGRAAAILELGEWGVRTALPQMVADRESVRRAFAAFEGTTPDHWAVSARRALEAAVAPIALKAREEIEDQLDELFALPCKNPGDALKAQLRELEEERPGRSAALAAFVEFVAPGADRGTRFDQVKLYGSAANWPAGGLDRAKALVRSLRQLAEGIRSAPWWTPEDDLAISATWHLRTIFEDACARSEARKRARNALDFQDIESRAISLLRGHPEVAASYSSNLRELLVDEFQDTNADQCELLDLLTGRASPVQAPRCRLFIVGDARQAIYGFRGSDLAQFYRYHDELVTASATPLELTRSFRTHDALASQVQALFEHTFSRYAPATPSGRMAGRGAGTPPAPHLTLLTIERSNADRKVRGRGRDEPSARTQRRYEAHAVAREIRSLLEARRLVWDRQREELRPVRPADIAVLLRRFTKVAAFEQALEAHGVPYSTLQGNGFFSRQEVHDLANLLAWLAESGDQVPLFGVLRSPMFAIDDATMAILRGVDPNDLLWALSSPPAHLPPEASARCENAARVLTALRRAAATEPVDELLARALAETGFEAAWAAVRGGEQAVANIRKLVDLARTLSDRSLDEFVEYVELRAEAEVREAQAVLDERDAVRLMTVHGAKGLEFPVVFIPEADMPPRQAFQAVRWAPGVGVAATLEKLVGDDARRPTAFHSWLTRLERAREDEEYWRILYVACTRAADYLCLTGIQAGEGARPTWVSAAVEAFELAPADLVDVRKPEPVDAAQMRRLSRAPAPIPDAEDEVEVAAPLVARPRVIPIRTSTPVTALREEAGPAARAAGHGDGLAALRGNVAHRALELRYGRGTEPDVDALAREMREAALPGEALRRVADEVRDMMERFESTPLARVLRGAEAHFEVPFVYDWDGVPVHGVLDLAYVADGHWNIVDFKTDALRGSLRDASWPYLAQLGLYGLALERATGSRPALSLLFLRTGEEYALAWADVTAALDRVRERVEAGSALDLAGEPAAMVEAL